MAEQPDQYNYYSGVLGVFFPETCTFNINLKQKENTLVLKTFNFLCKRK